MTQRPDGWEEVSLGDVISLIRHTVAPTSHPASFYVGLEHIEKNTGRLISRGSAVDVRSSKLAFQAGDVLYGKLRPNLNKVWRATVQGICSPELLVLRSSSRIESEFLAYRLLCNDFVQFATSKVNGVQLPRVSFSGLASFRFLLPPLDEQRIISAQILKLSDELEFVETSLRSAHVSSILLEQSLLSQAFAGELSKDFRASILPEASLDRQLRIKTAHFSAWLDDEKKRLLRTQKTQSKNNIQVKVFDERIRALKSKYVPPTSIQYRSVVELPAGWIYTSWAEISIVQNGRAFPSSAYATEGVRLLRPGNLANTGVISWSSDNTRHLSNDWAEKYPEYLLGPNELVMNLTAQSLADGFLGRVCMTTDGDECLLNQRIARLTVVGQRKKEVSNHSSVL